MESLKQGAEYISESAQKATSTGSKETNKNVAKDSNASIGQRYVSSSEFTEILRSWQFHVLQSLRCKGCCIGQDGREQAWRQGRRSQAADLDGIMQVSSCVQQQ